MFLQEFGDHPNVIKLHNVIKAENDKDIYLVFEFMGKFLKSFAFIQKCLCNINRNKFALGNHEFSFMIISKMYLKCST